MLKSAFIREQIQDETHLFHHLYQPCKNTLKLNRKYSKNFHLQITFIFIFHLRKKKSAQIGKQVPCSMPFMF